MAGQDRTSNAATKREPSDDFWPEAFAFREAVSFEVVRDTLAFTLWSVAVCGLNAAIHPDLGIEVTPYELAGAALSLLLVLRTNAGYSRWWEGRQLWGGIVNQSRTLCLTALTNGPDDPAWRSNLVRWTIAFAHVSRRTLRGERDLPEVAALLGADEAARLAAARHMPTAVSARIAALLREARETSTSPHVAVALLPAETSRDRLLDHIGGCERILKAPLPRVYGVNIRRFIFLFLGTLPFGLLAKLDWVTPLATLMIAYPILVVDYIGVALQNPFHPTDLGHLPLEDICATIEGDLLALLKTAEDAVVDRDAPIR